ncbi:MAG: hypothetical protein QM773_09980 [Hyphomonadaceae bacterium]
MVSVWVRAGVAAVVLSLLAGCASDQANVERGGVPGGTFACEGQPGMTLVVSNDGVYELRWGQGASATGWLEASGDQLKPTSGPLQGTIGRRSGDGISFPGGSVCSSFKAAS